MLIRSRVSYPTVVVLPFGAEPGKERDFDVTSGIDLSARGSHGGPGDPMDAETQTATLLAMT